MNLYRISQEQNRDFDTFDSAIVCALDEEGARAIHPDGPDRWGEQYPTWASSPEHVSVERIGVAEPGMEPGVVLASFNAG